MPFITVGQENSGPITLYYEDHGGGKPVVLIHGWPLSGKSWEKQVPALLNAGYRVIVYDRRGFGESAKPATGYDYNTLAADLDAVLTMLNLTDVTLVGFSMGGGEVARYLGRKGGMGRVNRAVFLASIVPALLKSPDNPEGLDQSIFDQIQQNILDDRPAFLRTFFKQFYNAGILSATAISDEMLDLSWAVASAASPIGTYQCVTAWQEDFRPGLEGIRALGIPVLVVHGDADKILPIENTGKRTSAALPGCQYVVVQGGPHGCSWTHADTVNAALLQFLNGQSVTR